MINFANLYAVSHACEIELLRPFGISSTPARTGTSNATHAARQDPSRKPFNSMAQLDSNEKWGLGRSIDSEQRLHYLRIYSKSCLWNRAAPSIWHIFNALSRRKFQMPHKLHGRIRRGSHSTKLHSSFQMRRQTGEE